MGAGAGFGIVAAAAMVGWLGGLWLQMQQTALPAAATSVWALVSAGAALVATAIAARRGHRLLLVVAMLGVASAAIGWSSTNLRAAEPLAQRLAVDLEGRDLRVSGVIASLPQRTSSGLRFEFEVDSARLGDEAVQLPPRLLLGWYSGFHEDATLMAPQRALRAGQRWTLDVRLRRPHGNLNPHGFDFERHLFERGLGATGYVRQAPAQVVTPAEGQWVLRWRQRLRDQIEERLGASRASGVLAALSLGDQSAIERDDWELFRTTGVAHLMSISGLHVTMFAWLTGLLVSLLWRRVPRLALALPAPGAAALFGWIAAAAYALFAGWGVPAQRTVWMLGVVTIGLLLGRRWPWTLVLGAAALVVTIVDPWAVVDPGFWLSFGAVALLMASNAWAGDEPARRGAAVSAGLDPAPWTARAIELVRGALRTQFVATVGLAPLTLLLFQQVSLVGFVANLIAVPWVTLVVTPLALLGAVMAPLWSLGAVAVEMLGTVLAWLARWPAGLVEAAAAPRWIQVAALVGGVVAVLPWPWRWRLLAIPLIAPLLLPPVPRPEPGQFEVTAVDVGQGTAVLVRTRAHLLVYDAGPQYSRDSDAGERVLRPLLRSMGAQRIDRLMLSHRDLDHVGGAAALLRAVPVGELSSSLEPGHPLIGLAGARGVATNACEDGQRWEWDGVRFEVLHPPAGGDTGVARPNARSCVLRVQAIGGAASILLTGDIEREQELGLVARATPALASRVLLAPHHGSRTSSSPEFLAAVAPERVVVQAGYRSRFGHPAPVVVQRYRERGIEVVSSATCGAWTWSSDEAAGRCERRERRRYWHHPGDSPAAITP